jgi:hypothetical protein
VTIIRSSLRIADAVAARLGVFQKTLSAEEMIQTACRRTGQDDFGETDFFGPLKTFVDACNSEADLSLVGRAATRWDTLRFLTNLLRLREAERADPSVLDEAIAAPVFITGLPRSGTTFLHRLMMEDAQVAAPLVWQTIYPYPTRADRGRDGRAGRVTSQLRAFERLAPEFRALHPLEAASPQECSEITAHVFRSLRFDTTYHVPSYRSWLDGEGHEPAYRFHKRFLQHLQHQHLVPGQPAPRWVVKCPDHLFALDAIRAVYPDARLVFVHRDPVKVLLSVAKLTEVLRDPFTRTIDREAIGRQESARWFEGTAHMMGAGETAGFDEPICHVHYLDLIADPLATVQAVYGQLDMKMTERTAERIEAVVKAQPDGGYGPRNYRFADHGLDAGGEREKFRGYMLHFGVQPEHERRVRGGPRNAAGSSSNGASLRSGAG